MKQLWFLLFPLVASGAFAQEFPADWKFLSLKTPHFEVVVNAKQQELGVLYARKLEQAYSFLSPLFTDKPERTVVVIADKTDITNGYATRIPYPHIFVYPVLPGPFESLGEGGDWILELVAHEYTHILSFEAVDGAMEPLQSVFGTIISPNLLLPRWWKEGVAVEMETRIGYGGRNRSAYQDATLRTMAEQGSLERFDIAQINEILPTWPEGMRPYLFGAIFWSEALDEKGSAVVDELHQHHGRRVPYFIEEPARQHLGSEYEDFYRRALRATERKIAAQEAILRTKAMTPIQALRSDSANSRKDVRYDSAPRVSADGKYLAVVSVDSTSRRSVRLFLRNSDGTFVNSPEQLLRIANQDNEQAPPTKDGPPSGSINRVSWMHASPRFIFDKVDAVSRFERYSDLWSYDLSNDKSRQLTFGLRAREPAVSPDDKSIAFVGLEGGRTYLGLLDVATLQSKRLWTGDWQDRISSPTFLDAATIAFALRDSKGEEFLYRLTVGEPLPQPFLKQFPQARAPEMTASGLVFTSAKNGVYNLYLADADLHDARPVTHVNGAIFSSTIDAKTGDLYVSFLTADGPRAGRVAAADRARESVLPVVEPLFAERYRTHELPAEPQLDPETDDYSPVGYLRPRYWFPLFAFSSNTNSLIVQLSTSGFDPLKKHLYAVDAAWDTGLNRGSGDFMYMNNVYDTSWIARGSQQATYLVTSDNPITNAGASLGIIPDLFPWSPYLSSEFGWRWLQTESTGTRATRSGPSAAVSYSDFSKSGTQISPERGWNGYLSAVSFLPGGDQLHYSQYAAGANFFFARGLPERHAIAARAHAVYTPDPLGAIYGVSTTNFFGSFDPVGPSYVMRGYRIGQFVGKSLNSLNLEYRFPVKEIRRGNGTDPYFLHRLHGAVFADGVSLDGAAYNAERELFESVSTSKSFWSVGAEARLETTIGYFLPLNFVLGVAWPQDRTFGDGPGMTTSIQLGALL